MNIYQTVYERIDEYLSQQIVYREKLHRIAEEEHNQVRHHLIGLSLADVQKKLREFYVEEQNKEKSECQLN